MHEIAVAEPLDGPASAPLGTDASAHSDHVRIRDLTEALRRGDELAYRELHREYHQKLLRYCLALASGDDDRASEILQRTYLRVTRSMKRLPHEAALWQWLIKAAKCSAIDIARGRKRYSALLARFGEFLRRTPTDADAGESLHDALEVALGKLDAGERELIEEKYFQRRTLDEIARTRGFTAKAVERRLARVRERLRTTISNHLKAEQLP